LKGADNSAAAGIEAPPPGSAHADVIADAARTLPHRNTGSVVAA
jgi:hypothetical protein